MDYKKLNNSIKSNITGNHFFYWTNLPTNLADYISNNSAFKLLDNSSIENILSSSCIGIELPDRKLTKDNNILENNTVIIRFSESSDLPIFNIIHNWINMIVDCNKNQINDPSKYKSTLYYWTTYNNCNQVKFNCSIDGIYPIIDPINNFSYNSGNKNEKLEFDIEFSFDSFNSNKSTHELCQKYMNSMYNNDKTIENKDLHVCEEMESVEDICKYLIKNLNKLY